MAIEVAEWLGMIEQEIEKAIQKIKPLLAVEQGRDGLKVINSTYSANPQSVFAHLDYLKGLSGKKIIVMPCLIELGKAAETVHRKIGRKIGRVCDLAIITTCDYFQQIKQAAVEAGMNPNHILLAEKPDAILQEIRSFAVAPDTLLLESRVPEQVIKNLLVRNSSPN